MSLIRSTLNAFVLAEKVNRLQTICNVRYVKRWVAPTLRELQRRKEKLGPEQAQPRSSFIEWNYRSELFAFGKRLNEDYDINTLQKAFTNRSYILKEEKRQRDLGVENADINMSDNTKLTESGRQVVEQYVGAYLKYSLPRVPEQGLRAIFSFLLSETTLSHVAHNLGMKELVFSCDYPPSAETMMNSLLAVIGALKESSGEERAFLFVRDFVCTQLNQKDLMELWEINNPEELLKDICKERKMAEPEPRLIGDCASKTVLAAYHVGLYSNKQLIGKGFGEDIPTAIQTASLDALRTMFGIQDSMKPLNFLLQVEKTKRREINTK